MASKRSTPGERATKDKKEPLIVQVFPLTEELHSRLEAVIEASNGQLRKSAVLRDALEKLLERKNRTAWTVLQETPGVSTKIPVSARVRRQLVTALEQQAQKKKVKRSVIVRSLLSAFLPEVGKA